MTLWTLPLALTFCCPWLSSVAGDGFQEPFLAAHSKIDSVALPRSVSFEGDFEYERQQSTYWTKQQSLQHPGCRIAPKSPEELALVLTNIGHARVPFAVKSGGHSSVRNTSNVDCGITVDLFKMASVEVSKDRKTTWVGAGARWRDVYRQLDSANLSVSGGRAADPGVGGYLLGGGISYFSGSMGWACDGVEAFEVVLSNGSIIEANEKEHEDLFWALKGGSNNFGVVARFRLTTFPQYDFYSAVSSYNPSYTGKIFAAIENFNENAAEDPDASVLLSIAFIPPGLLAMSNVMVHTQNTHSSPVFSELKSIPTNHSMERSTRMLDLAEFMDHSNPGGTRVSKATFTVLNSAAMLLEIQKVFLEFVANETISENGSYQAGMAIQPITTAHLSKAAAKGGNAMGLSGEDGPLISKYMVTAKMSGLFFIQLTTLPLIAVIFLEVHWSNPSHDSLYQSMVNNFIDQCTRKAKAMKMLHPFRFLNYASGEQEVFASYGNKSLDRLRRIRDQYDPVRVFTNSHAGPFKLDKHIPG